MREGDLEGTVRIVGHAVGPLPAPSGMIETRLDLLDRLSPTIVRTITRPYRIETMLDGRLIVSTASRARQEISGRWDIVSHRVDAQAFDREDGRHELLLGRLAAAALGARHVCETDGMLGSGTLMRTVATLSPYRTIVPTMPQQAIAARLVDGRGAVALGELADALHPVRVSGMAIALGLTIRRYVAIDLETPIGPDSVVRPVLQPSGHLPGLFERLCMGRPLS